MGKAAKTRSAASSIRLQIERGGEKLWHHNDFRDQPFPAVAQTLSRLTRNGTLERLSKGVYYRPAQLPSDRAVPAPRQSRDWQREPRRSFHPAPQPPICWVSARKHRGEASWQQAPSVSPRNSSVPRPASMHGGRKHGRACLRQKQPSSTFYARAARQANCLPNEPLRRPWSCWQRIVTLNGCSRWLIRTATGSRSPGRTGRRVERDRAARARLRASLNPFSRFGFGEFASLTHARKWQAKERPKT